MFNSYICDRRKKYYNNHYSRRLFVGDRKSDNPSLLSNFANFCSYKLYPEVYRLYIALKTFAYFTVHLIKIYFKYKMRTALCIIAVLQVTIFKKISSRAEMTITKQL